MDKLYVTIREFASVSSLNRDEEFRYKIPIGEVCFNNYKYHILDGGTIFLDKTLKFVYLYYYGDFYKYKVIKIQSKPSKGKNIKHNILQYKKLLDKENELQKEKKILIELTKRGCTYYG